MNFVRKDQFIFFKHIYQQMNKRKHKSEICAYPKISEFCTHCIERDNNIALTDEIQISLVGKYGKSGIDATQSSNFDHFVEGKSKVFQGGYQQFKRFYNPHPMMFKYYRISDTLQKITDIIKQCLNKQKNSPVHFKGCYLETMYKYKQLKFNSLSKYSKPSDVAHSTQTGELKRYKKSSSKNLKGILNLHRNNKLLNSNNILEFNQSFEHILKLRSTIDEMCSNFSSKKISNFEEEIKKTKFSSDKKNKKKLSLFTEEIEKKFSEIRLSKSKSKSKTKQNKKIKKCTRRAQTQTEQIYGLDQYYKQTSPKKQRQQGYHQNYRIQTDRPYHQIYDSPVSQAYYPRAHLQTQRSDSICTNPKKKSIYINRKQSVIKKNKTTKHTTTNKYKTSNSKNSHHASKRILNNSPPSLNHKNNIRAQHRPNSNSNSKKKSFNYQQNQKSNKKIN